ncbi:MULTISPECIES: SDR family NAD(P)-dependent oxidoreductase [Stutzerimonas]|uniref:SDR family NAD(P)-dependent oxidoreductase n=1 Tax=Stutzerimonas TaxID=2901164 RepID=UPI0007737831|nr:SDR family NAD(P)-dependent oxidoreductase [Stutzerimonas balearica]MBD3738466.1 SDR family NAD(P)-dependent oxidoreductase [Stutzerimonas balearica]MBS4150804.1 SDR family NAD(P)-dependent oxidoreductase [Stutzerimonas balearica]OMG62883.1 short-chain dehydrogenase [Stutzerimonas balearica]WIX03855.1 SDR family NAD(P)-dependent oxidoreductase [Pseudomonas sp. AR5]
MQMQSFPSGYRALVIGASGGIGAALVAALREDPRCAQVVELGRATQPALDLAEPASIERAAAELAGQGAFQLIVNAAGVLHDESFMPEKRLADLNPAQLLATFQVNTFGPALLLRYFCGLLDRQRGVLAMLSAKVGSIGDNRLGGWYSYRASKAALNMLIKTAAIEVRRSQPNAVLLALHPGTVNSALSQPFRGAEIGRPAAVAAHDLLRVIDSLGPEASGSFHAYDGQPLPW